MVKKIRLNTLQNTRRSLARLIREYHSLIREGLLSDENTPRYRSLVYSLKALVESFKIESDLGLEARLLAIEAKLKEKGL